MKNIRVIARLDIKYPHLIKGVNLEGVRIVGDPNQFAKKYYNAGIDEILYHDAVATLYGRNNLEELVRYTAKDIFVPMTVGGGIRTVSDVDLMLRAGADKISINSAVISNPILIKEIASRFGCQCVVVSIEAKKKMGNKHWEAYTDGGREKTGVDVLEWVEIATEMGAGEFLLTSIDQEGTCEGYDIELIKAVSAKTKIPIIASGGMGKNEHALKAIEFGGADALAIAHVLHYEKINLLEFKNFLVNAGYEVRQ